MGMRVSFFKGRKALSRLSEGLRPLKKRPAWPPRNKNNLPTLFEKSYKKRGSQAKLIIIAVHVTVSIDLIIIVLLRESGHLIYLLLLFFLIIRRQRFLAYLSSRSVLK